MDRARETFLCTANKGDNIHRFFFLPVPVLGGGREGKVGEDRRGEEGRGGEGRREEGEGRGEDGERRGGRKGGRRDRVRRGTPVSQH